MRERLQARAMLTLLGQARPGPRGRAASSTSRARGPRIDPGVALLAYGVLRQPRVFVVFA